MQDPNNATSAGATTTPTDEQIALMGEEDLLKDLSGSTEPNPPVQTDPPAAAPAAGDTSGGTPGSETPGEKKEPGAPGGAEGAAPAAAAPATETTYAGKYKSTEELVAGIREISKKLGFPFEDHAERLIDAATAAKSFKDVEAAYQKYEQEFGKRNAPPAAPAGAAPKADAAATTTDGALTDGKLTADEQKAVEAEAKESYVQTLAAHPVMRLFREAGEPIPKTREELNALSQRDFVLAQKYLDALVEVKDSVASQYAEIGKLKAELPTLLQNSITEATADVKAAAGKLGLTLTDDEVKAIVTEGMSTGDALIFESRRGFQVPRAHGLLRWFKAEKLEELVGRVRESAVSEGRKKHMEDLEKMRGQQKDSIGNTQIPGRKVAVEVAKVDMNDPAQVAMLTEEQILESMK